MNKFILIMLIASLAGCATYRPIIDGQGVNDSDYERDLAACQRYADSTSPASSAVGGAAVVAGIGAALAAIAGIDIGTTAAMGAVLGGVSGLGRGAVAQQDIIRNCLRGRGYSVLQ